MYNAFCMYVHRRIIFMDYGGDCLIGVPIKIVRSGFSGIEWFISPFKDHDSRSAHNRTMYSYADAVHPNVRNDESTVVNKQQQELRIS